MTAFYTIGYGGRALDGFIAILKQAGIEALVDIRSQPQSTSSPQFTDDSLRVALIYDRIP